jgi:uncharacterized membrane protein YgaE (UPF0421/DUF939 family)
MIRRAIAVFDWIVIGGVAAFLFFMLGHNFPISY